MSHVTHIELVSLCPNNQRARRLAVQTLLFSEFLVRCARDAALPSIERPALVQIHCHHHSVIKPEAERELLDRLRLDYEIVLSGCCGMAGAFGFEASKYPLSMKLAERILLPKVRAAPAHTLVLADGFSCREQIEQGAGRKTLHITELIANAWPATA